MLVNCWFNIRKHGQQYKNRNQRGLDILTVV